jgi:lambda family phage portal protein
MTIVQRQLEAIRRGVSARTLADRVVEYFNPKTGLERLRSRVVLATAVGQGGYEGGRRDRRGTKLWRPQAGSADADTLPDLPDLRARTRDLARNVPLATGAIATKVTNVVGDGLQLQACIDAKTLGLTDEQADRAEQENEREWAAFCKSADFTRVQHFDELSALALRSVSESGDVFVVRRYRKDQGDAYGTKLQLVEADRVSNPHRAADTDAISGGVEVDGDGVPRAYHVSDRHPGNMRTAAIKWARVPAWSPTGKRVVLHLFDRLRPDLTRGVPYLAPVIEELKQLGDYSDAEVRAAVTSALVTWFIQTSADEDTGEPVIGERAPNLASDEVKLGSGAVISLGPGEKPVLTNPSRPNEKFDPFFLAMTRQIGVALELPQELLIKHFTASYSASRAALEMAWQFFRRCRTWLARNLHAHVYEWMMEEAVASGRLDRPGFFDDPVLRQAWLGAEWIGPARASLNPYQEAQADALDIETGTKTREQVCMERTGGRVERKTAQLVKEQKLRTEGGLGAPAASEPDATDAGDTFDAADDSEDETEDAA